MNDMDVIPLLLILSGLLLVASLLRRQSNVIEHSSNNYLPDCPPHDWKEISNKLHCDKCKMVAGISEGLE